MQKVKKLEPNIHVFCEDFAVKKKSHDLENYGMKMVWKTLSVNLFHYHGCCHIVCPSVLHCQCEMGMGRVSAQNWTEYCCLGEKSDTEQTLQ